MKRIDFTDSEARQAIFKELDVNLFIEASAGSGKTTSLVNRMVALVEAGKPVSEICTITFTVAAADEFFSRFQELLSRRSIDNPNDESIKDLGLITEESKKRCQEALNNIDQCFTGTMDSFSNMVAHELPNELDLPSDAKIISDEEKARIINEECFNILSDENHPCHKDAALIVKAFGTKISFDVIYSALISIFDYRDYEVVFNRDLLDSHYDPIKKDINDYLSFAKTLVKNDAISYLAATHHNDFNKIISIANINEKYIHDWRNHTQQILRSIGGLKPSIKFPTEVSNDTEISNYLEPDKKSFVFSKDIQEKAKKIEDTINEFLHQTLFVFVTKARDGLVKKMKENGTFTFFDFLYYLTQKFKENCVGNRELINHICERHKYFLIDESQDTNPMQTEMFFYLTSTVKTDDWTKTEPKEGSLFIVGDPKQSIYGFRDADVNAFNTTKQLFANKDELLFLTKNFRSNIVLKEWFNKVMNDVLARGNPKTPLVHKDIPVVPDPKEPKEVERAKLEDDKNITLYKGVYYYDSGCTNKNAKDKDAEPLAKLIKLIVKNENYKIISKRVPDKNNPARTIDYKDILVITKTKSVEKYVEAFAKEGIPFMVEARIYFKYSETLLTVADLLRLVFEPHKVQHFINVVSQLYAFDSKDIMQMKLDGFGLDISNIKDNDDNDIAFTNKAHEKAVKELNELYLATRGMTVSSTFFYILNDSNCLFSNKVDHSFLGYAYYIYELIRQKENEGSIVTFMDADKFITDVINGNSDLERAMQFTKNIDQVKISNLHKVKGLQAPVVILAEPAEGKKEATKYVDRVNKKLYLSKITYKDSHKSDRTACVSVTDIQQASMDLAKKDLEAEAGRLEYVAATRAESVLIIAKPPKTSDGSQNPWQELMADKDIEKVPEWDESEKVVVEKNIGNVTKGFISAINKQSNEASFKVENPSGARVRVVSNEEEVIEKDEDNSDKAYIGTLVHKLLECIVTSKNNYDFAQLIEVLQGEYCPKESEKDYSKLLEKVANTFVNGGFKQTTDDVPQDLFKVLMEAEDVMCELPFAYKTESGNVVSGTIDLLYKDKSGWHVIDYKTNVEGDIKVLEQEYAGQLDMYTHAFNEFAKGEKLIDAHIYHINF